MFNASMRGPRRGHVYTLRFEETVADFDAALALRPLEAPIYENRALARRKVNDFAGAVEDYRIASALRSGALQRRVDDFGAERRGRGRSGARSTSTSGRCGGAGRIGRRWGELTHGITVSSNAGC